MPETHNISLDKHDTSSEYIWCKWLENIRRHFLMLIVHGPWLSSLQGDNNVGNVHLAIHYPFSRFCNQTTSTARTSTLKIHFNEGVYNFQKSNSKGQFQHTKCIWVGTSTTQKTLILYSLYFFRMRVRSPCPAQEHQVVPTFQSMKVQKVHIFGESSVSIIH